MSLDTALNKLKASFDEVANEIEQAYPAAWSKLHDWYGDDTETKVQTMLKKPIPGIGDKSLLEIADELGDEAVVDCLETLENGYA